MVILAGTGMVVFSSDVTVRELPLFPLPEVVLFTSHPLPLHIFEYRYRIMMNTILESDRRFGVLLFDPESQGIARVGCCAEVIRYQRLEDDRLHVWTIGQQRFRVLEFTRTKPYFMGMVEWIEDERPSKDLHPLAENVEQLLRDVVRLSSKLSDRQMQLPENLPSLPIELSYWVAANLYGVYPEQQHLLELQDTEARLEREMEILGTTRSHLAARTVLKDTLG
jgi:ATP-dependent Lon protease